MPVTVKRISFVSAMGPSLRRWNSDSVDDVCRSIDLREGVRTELVSHPLFDAVALDDVPRLHVVREDDHLFPDGTACLLDLAHQPDAVPYAHPEREARSVRSVEPIADCDPRRDRDVLSSPLAERHRHPRPPLGRLNPPRRKANGGIPTSGDRPIQAKPSSRSSFPRSKPTTASPSMMVTGVARKPSLINSSRATASARMSLAV
jgi:hypothetical protein